MNLKPLGDRLIVVPLEEEQTTSAASCCRTPRSSSRSAAPSSPSAPASAAARPVSVIPMDVAEGDTVVFSKYGGTEIKIEGEDYLILRESDVLAKVVGSTAKPVGAKA